MYHTRALSTYIITDNEHRLIAANQATVRNFDTHLKIFLNINSFLTNIS